MRATCWAVAGLVLLAPAAMAAGKDGLWEITTRMEGMPEMPAGISIPGMPGGAQKQTVCLAEGRKYEREEQKECKILEQRQSGKKSFVKVRCKEGTMTIEHEQVSRDLWRSKMTMSGEHAMTVNSEGKRVGSCDAAQEGGMTREGQQALGQAQAQSAANAAELGRQCQQAVADWPGAHPFEQYDLMAGQRKEQIARSKGQNMKVINATFPEVPHCAKAKADYCAKSKAAGREIATRKGYAAFFGKPGQDATAALRYCGVESTALLAGHCKSAAAEDDYAFVAAHCPDQRKALAARHCAGRSYSSVEPKYQPLCGGGRDYSAQEAKAPGAMDRLKGLLGGGSSGDAPAAGGRDYTAASGASGGSGGQVEEGVKQLKKLFGF